MGSTPDASVVFTLPVTVAATGIGTIVISEVAPWSSGDSPLGADWFEVTNIGSAAVDTTGWKMDDNSNSFGSAVALNGITSIAPGESVIFVESDAPATAIPAFKTLWFGANPPARLQVGTYSGSGVGLSTGGDAVNLFNSSGVLQANVTFDISPAGPVFGTFDNSGGLNNAAVSLLSAVGVNGTLAAIGDVHEIGSPGSIGPPSPPTVTVIAPDARASESGSDPGTFRITRSGSIVNSLTINYTLAAGTRQATSADYTPALTGVAIIPAGQSFLDIIITPVDDTLVEGPEKVTMTLSDTGSYDVGAPATATITIADNDVANKPPSAVALSNTITSITQDTSTVSAVKVADIAVTDDGVGTNTLSLAGTDAGSFEIVGSALYLKSGTVLNSVTKPSYSVTVNVDDPTVGNTPDASVVFTLTVTPPLVTGSIVITEVAPWSSSSPAGADWFEVTNISTKTVNIAGWKMDDNSNSLAAAVALNGITNIAPGESVIFLESDAPATVVPAFKTLWFGANPPPGLQIGTYEGASVGLSTSADAVNLFNSAGVLEANVTFAASPAGPSLPTFENADGLNNTAISQLSVTGVHNAIAAVNDANEIGSPGTSGKIVIASVTVAGGGDQVAPNTWLEIKGNSLAPASTAAGLLWSNAPEFAQGKMPTTLGGASVTVNGRPAYIYYVSPTQVNVLTSLDATTGPVDVTLKNGTATSAPFTVIERAASPAFFLFGVTKYIAATHADFSYLGPPTLSVPGTPFTPARPNEIVVLYANGFGLPATALTEGSSSQSSPLTVQPVIQIGGIKADVVFAGVVSPGLYQLNVTVPATVPDGDNAVSISYGSVQAPAGALITVKR